MTTGREGDGWDRSEAWVPSPGMPSGPPLVPEAPAGWFEPPAPPVVAADLPAGPRPGPWDRRTSAGRWTAAGTIALVGGLVGVALSVAAGFVWFWVALLATDPHDPEAGGAFVGWFVVGLALLASVVVALVGLVLLVVGGAVRATRAIP